MSELRKLRQLEEENAQLRKFVADLSLDKQVNGIEYGKIWTDDRADYGGIILY